jgi:hypothetical protein
MLSNVPVTSTVSADGQSMEILCPSCQRKLTILEQYAGQQMKCPLCANTFTAPALPSAAGMPVGPPPAPPPPQPPLPPPTQDALSPSGADIPLPQEPVPTDHTGRFSVWISPRITQYVPAAALFVVLILTFARWVGYYPGGVWVASQSAWQAVGGSMSIDSDLEEFSPFRKAAEKDAKEEGTSKDLGRAAKPGFEVLVLFYILAVMVNFGLAAAVVAFNFTEKYLPPIVKQYAKWRWPALALVTFGTFAILLLTDLLGFSFEHRLNDANDKASKTSQEIFDKVAKGSKLSEREVMVQNKMIAIKSGEEHQAVVRTFWYRSVFWLQFWALVFVFATMLAELRTPRPCPRVDLLW